jgi:hypothetical protein
MNSLDSRPLCACCGDRIGVYEPVWLERPDGTRVRSGLLELGETLPDGRIFHSECLAGGGLTG